MPVFVAVVIAALSILLVATAADGRLWQASHTAMAASFDPSPYRAVPGREPGR